MLIATGLSNNNKYALIKIKNFHTKNVVEISKTQITIKTPSAHYERPRPRKKNTDLLEKSEYFNLQFRFRGRARERAAKKLTAHT